MQISRIWIIASVWMLCFGAHGAEPKPEAPAVSPKTSETNQVAAPSEKDKPTKIVKWRDAAEKGETWARFNLGLAHHAGQEVAKNLVEAVKWYRLAAEQGYGPAQANLGYCYDTGSGVEIDHVEAVKWYQLAAVQGNAFAQYNLAKKYQNGPGVALNSKEAEKWFRSAAQQNFVPAYFSLGQIYANDYSGTPNYAEAFKWFRMAAEQDYAAAQHAIGYLYFSGKGVQTNYFEAVKWYTQAASRNFADSHYNLGYCFENGLGVPQNLTAAVNHYRSAAESGHPQAQYSLGVCYYEGKGLEAEYVQAYKWWNLAAVQGIPEANSSREILSRLMPEAKVKEAQKLAGEFVPKRKSTSESPALLQIASTDATDVKRIATGFLITTNGYLVTNFRMIAGATNIHVITESGTFEAVPFRTEPLNDIAILKIEGHFQPLNIAYSRDATAEAEFIAVGFDMPNPGQFSPKIARGKITSLLGFQADPRQFTLEPHLPTSYAGSALFNKRGHVIGVTLPDLDDTLPEETRKKLITKSSYSLKSEYLISFLKTMPEIKYNLDESKSEISSDEILAKARAATALIIVL
jgi:TPR repeat protein